MRAASFFWCGGRLVLSILDDLKPAFEVLTPADGAWSRTLIACLPDLGTLSSALRPRGGRVERGPAGARLRTR